jgi:hypothetical protein
MISIISRRTLMFSVSLNLSNCLLMPKSIRACISPISCSYFIRYNSLSSSPPTSSVRRIFFVFFLSWVIIYTPEASLFKSTSELKGWSIDFLISSRSLNLSWFWSFWMSLISYRLKKISSGWAINLWFSWELSSLDTLLELSETACSTFCSSSTRLCLSCNS